MFAVQEPLPTISAHEIATQPLPPVNWIVAPILSTGERALVYGEFGALKSWVLLHLGLHIAAGRKWLDTFDIPESRPVLYVDEEMSEYTLRRRTKRLLLGMGLTDVPFFVASRIGFRVTDMGAHILLDRVRRAALKPQVIIVEALRRVLIGSENEAKDVSAFWRGIEPLVKEDRSLGVSHHMRKPKDEGMADDTRYRASGSTDLLAGCDVAWAVTRPKGAPYCKMECTKIRLAEEPKPFTLEFDFGVGPDAPITAHLAPDRDPVDSQGGRAVIMIEAALQASGSLQTAEIITLCEDAGISRPTAFRALQALHDQGRAHKEEQGTWSVGPYPSA